MLFILDVLISLTHILLNYTLFSKSKTKQQTYIFYIFYFLAPFIVNINLLYFNIFANILFQYLHKFIYEI